MIVAAAGVYENQKVLESGKKEIMEKPKVAITFDDGPSKLHTEKLLDGLLIRDVKATFFVIGKNIEGNEKIIERMNKEGHIIGNHTYSHAQLACVKLDVALEEISKSNEIIKEITENEVEYIRPPYGNWSQGLEDNVRMIKVKWTVDPRDWSVLNADSVADYVVKVAKDGDIILLHDIYETSVEAALKIIDRLKEKGFEFVTIDELDGVLWLGKFN